MLKYKCELPTRLKVIRESLKPHLTIAKCVFFPQTLITWQCLILSLKSRIRVLNGDQWRLNSSVHSRVTCCCVTLVGGKIRFFVVCFRCWNWAESFGLHEQQFAYVSGVIAKVLIYTSKMLFFLPLCLCSYVWLCSESSIAETLTPNWRAVTDTSRQLLDSFSVSSSFTSGKEKNVGFFFFFLHGCRYTLLVQSLSS